MQNDVSIYNQWHMLSILCINRSYTNLFTFYYMISESILSFKILNDKVQLKPEL